jgi:Skp family chaperone for outer membrane proteins
VQVAPSAAQTFSLGTASPMRTLDQERLFAESQFGRRMLREQEAAAQALAAENAALLEELTREELALSDRRDTLPQDEFRALADAFDARVTRIRTQQEERARALARQRDADRQRFFEAVVPILAQLLRETGAVAIIDSRTVILASEDLDMTDLAIQILNARLGDGADVGDTDAPSQTPPAEINPDGIGDAAPPPGVGEGRGNGEGSGPPILLPPVDPQ